MDQHTYVKYCQDYYKEEGLTPGNPDDGEWQDAHYPAPKGVGGNTILLLFDHHQVQGLLQSEEYGRCCFFIGHTKKFLNSGCFIGNWFDLWDIYDKWKDKAVEKMQNHPNTQKARVENGRKNIKKMNQKEVGKRGGQRVHEIHPELAIEAAKRMCAHPNSIETRKNNGKISSGQKWKCLETGHISTPMGLSNYQRARGIDTALRVKVE